jgi:hypothetical protein
MFEKDCVASGLLMLVMEYCPSLSHATLRSIVLAMAEVSQIDARSERKIYTSSHPLDHLLHTHPSILVLPVVSYYLLASP